MKFLLWAKNKKVCSAFPLTREKFSPPTASSHTLNRLLSSLCLGEGRRLESLIVCRRHGRSRVSTGLSVLVCGALHTVGVQVTGVGEMGGGIVERALADAHSVGGKEAEDIPFLCENTYCVPGPVLGNLDLSHLVFGLPRWLSG